MYFCLYECHQEKRKEKEKRNATAAAVVAATATVAIMESCVDLLWWTLWQVNQKIIAMPIIQFVTSEMKKSQASEEIFMFFFKNFSLVFGSHVNEIEIT